MRVVKEPEVRKAEILDAAEKLFVDKGYDGTSVNNVIEAVGLSKGAFYYYFKSKEDVLNEILEKRINEGVKRAEEIAASPLSPLQKCLGMIMAQQFRYEYEHIVAMFQDNSTMLRKRSAVLNEFDTKYILRLSSCFGKVIEEGIETGLFSTPFPVESFQILLSAAFAFFHWDYLPWAGEEAKVKVAAFLMAMERILGAKAGTFSEYQNLFVKDVFYTDIH